MRCSPTCSTFAGRRSVPPRIVAVVMVLQRLHGLSDREAVEAFEFDARWKYACGGLDFDHPGFVHTVLVDMRARLARSDRPRRIFEVSLDAARRAGIVSARRVLDSTPIYDAVATQDTVTMIRSAIRRLLAVADAALRVELRAVLRRDDDYASAGKPSCDWDDPAAREALVGELATDALACLEVVEGREFDIEVAEAVELLATVIGQDLEAGDDGVFRIARKVAKDRVISTVDPETRHGHKTRARGFDGYKGHVAVDPDSEIITDTTVTPGNAGDATVATDLIDDLIDDHGDRDGDRDGDGDNGVPGEGLRRLGLRDRRVPTAPRRCRHRVGLSNPATVGARRPVHQGPLRRRPRQRHRHLPDSVTVTIRRGADGGGMAYFAEHCTTCPLRAQCTNATAGRTISVKRHEAALARARARQADPDWRADYRATRPKVERKLGHLMRRRHGGRRARVRGRPKVDADFNLLAAAANLARLAVLELRSTPTGWAVTA